MESLYRFSHDIRVRYAEIDGQKIVFNAHYFTYLDVAFTEYMRELVGSIWVKDPHSLHFDPVLVKSKVQYRKPAVLDDLIRVFVRVKRLGTSSLTVECLIKRENDILIEAELVHVNYDLELKQSVPLPTEIKAKIREFECI
ncbi:acyl-CoA thioesterase [Fredinandcohnia humi]